VRRHNAFVCLAHGSWVCLHRPILPTPQLLVFVYLTNLVYIILCIYPAGMCVSRLLLSYTRARLCLSMYAPVLNIKKISCSQSLRDLSVPGYKYMWQKKITNIWRNKCVCLQESELNPTIGGTCLRICSGAITLL